MKQAISIVAILCALALAALAQHQQPLYTVQPSDTLWQLSNVKLNDPLQWQKVVDANPFLKQPGRVFATAEGKTIVLIRPGEQLAGLDKIGILPQVTSVAQLGVAPAPPPPPPSTESYTWMWLLLGLLAALLALAYLAYRKWFRPEQAGPAVIRGGINHATAPEAMRAQVAHDFGLPANGIHVTSITAGTATGWAAVGYADRDRPQYLRNRPCFECRFTADGQEGEQLAYSLMGCGNPVRYGRPDVLPGRDFVFTANRRDAAVSLPAEWTQTTTPEAAPAIAESSPKPGRLTVHFDDDSTATIAADGHELVIENVGNDVTANRTGNAVVLQRGDYRIVVAPDGRLRMPDAQKPAERTLPEVETAKALLAKAGE